MDTHRTVDPSAQFTEQFDQMLGLPLPGLPELDAGGHLRCVSAHDHDYAYNWCVTRSSPEHHPMNVTLAVNN